jgi:hypothetical protein
MVESTQWVSYTGFREGKLADFLVEEADGWLSLVNSRAKKRGFLRRKKPAGGSHRRNPEKKQVVLRQK